jgi:hypothetical protein
MQTWPPFDRAPEPLGMTINPRALAGAAELVLAILLLVLLPLGIWFILAPLALGVRAVIVPGHVMSAAVLAAAAIAYIALYQRAKLLGSGLAGAALLLVAAAQTSIAAGISTEPNLETPNPELTLNP